ncbi:HAD-IIIC family phosphatase [Zavarzinia sp.]|uniref:HAD-IIIC family phosphatase n=1 Tax=Zavarzinia sp. TaxID=2027920 RepID=UPI0035696EA2
MAEPVRLVIWDLDETFWRGTLSEGGVELDPRNVEMVITLAKRGIMSSICSKNDHEAVKAVLVDAGIWDYFIFPSINWEPKGQRIAGLIDDVQLRPASVLFIDDNPMNLNEARHFLPDLQLADEKYIPSILEDQLFRGKDDTKLSRLKQYKLLEVRKAEEKKAGADNTSFLRASDIRVVIDTDIAANLDRAIELVNRTNQLNFTKIRLPEDLEAARNAMRAMIADPTINMGIVSVSDRYGDYGHVGFYAVKLGNKKKPKLQQFCFSCRILNMGVETWLYRKLGSPSMKVVGEVLTDVVGDDRTIDWIAEGKAAPKVTTDSGAVRSKKMFNRIVFRGGCEQRALAHYFTKYGESLFGEHNFPRYDIAFRLEHSMYLRHAADGLSEESAQLLYRLGFTPEDLRSELFVEADGPNLAVISFWTDARMGMLKHKESGLLVPYAPLHPGNLDPEKADPKALEAARTVQAEFTRAGYISEEQFKDNVRVVLSRIPSNTSIAMVLANTYTVGEDGVRKEIPNAAEYNQWVREALVDFPDVLVFDIRDYVENEKEVPTPTHFARPVHFRLAEAIIGRLRARMTQMAAE